MWTLVLFALRMYGAPGIGCDGLRAELEISNVNLIDPYSGQLTRGATISINNGRICRIESRRHTGRLARNGAAKPPAALRRIDGRGRFALPGFQAASAIGDEQIMVGFGVTSMSGFASLRADRFDEDVHDQMAKLVSEGKSTLQALQAGVGNPLIESVTYEQSSGFNIGADATLLLLEQNPLENIENTRSISLVVLRGEVVGLRQLARARAGRPIDLQPFSR
jgi:imidazolonepropionase-like amidohydrolase